jgi:FMN-dependent NADH-azoreductase
MVLGECNYRREHGSVIRDRNATKKRMKMKHILLIESSPRGAQSYSHQAALSVLNQLQARHPEAKVVKRDLAENPPPHVGQAFISAIQAQPEELTPQQVNALAFSELLIAEVLEADLIVLAAPVHNFGIPSTLKAWIDHIVRAGRTFSYTSNGPKGLVTGKRVILALASGGVFSDGPAKPFDFHETYLRAVLGFIGITEVELVRVEGVAMSAIGPQKALAFATARTPRFWRTLLESSPKPTPHPKPNRKE